MSNNLLYRIDMSGVIYSYNKTVDTRKVSEHWYDARNKGKTWKHTYHYCDMVDNNRYLSHLSDPFNDKKYNNAREIFTIPIKSNTFQIVNREKLHTVSIVTNIGIRLFPSLIPSPTLVVTLQ